MSMREEIMRAAEAIDHSPRAAAWVGRKVAIWDLLIDSGARVEEDGTPSPVLYADVEVRYDETHPPGMVTVLDQYGDVLVRMLQAPSRTRWYAAHLGSWMNTDEPVDPAG